MQGALFIAGFVFTCSFGVVAVAGAQAPPSQPPALIEIAVTADTRPVPQAQVIVSGKTSQTDANGRITLQVPPGPIAITVVKEGFNPVTVTATAVAGQPQLIPIALERQAAIEEHVTVSATRTDKRIEDQPMRVEVLDAEEIEEKQLMTPGDIVMMLNEMGGLRVQATSPSLGAASVRVQGMRGRYTRFLSDGLPLFGADVGGLGLPADSTVGPRTGRSDQGCRVRTLWSRCARRRRRPDFQAPGQRAARDALVNRTSRGGTDAVLFAAQPLSDRVERHGARRRPLAAAQRRGRRRMGGSGGLLARRRASAALLERSIRPVALCDRGRDVGRARMEARCRRRCCRRLAARSSSRSTRHAWTEAWWRKRLSAGRYVMTARFSATHKDEHYRRGEVPERDLQDTVFAEMAMRGTAPRQTWVAGVAFERSTLDARDQPQFSYGYDVPGLFAQDDIEVNAMADALGQRTPRRSQCLRHVPQSAHLRVAAQGRLDNPGIGRRRIFCADGPHGRNRGRGTRTAHDSHAALGRARPERVTRPDENTGPD